MTIDLRKFLHLYFEENEIAQKLLLQCLRNIASNDDSEGALVSAIRAAHLIKGSSGAFGFNEIVDLAAALELVLVRMQRHELVMSDALGVVCSRGVEEIGRLLAQRQQGVDVNAKLAGQIGVRLTEWPTEHVATGIVRASS